MMKNMYNVVKFKEEDNDDVKIAKMAIMGLSLFGISATIITCIATIGKYI